MNKHIGIIIVNIYYYNNGNNNNMVNMVGCNIFSCVCVCVKLYFLNRIDQQIDKQTNMNTGLNKRQNNKATRS